MDKMIFEDLPSTKTPISSSNLNKMQSNIEKSAVIISALEPTTSEKVWIKKSKNKFNKNNMFVGFRFGSDGFLIADSNYSATRFEEVEPSTNYIANWTLETRECICYYDENKKFISRNVGDEQFTTPANCRYIRASRLSTGTSSAQIEQGTQTTSYEAHVEPKIYLKNDNGIFEEFVKNEDTGWIPLTVGSNFTNFSWMPLAYRKIGNVVYIHGGGTLDTSISKDIVQLPTDCIPRSNIQHCCLYNSGTTIQNISITSSGLMTLLSTGSTSSKIELTINMSFVAG